MSLRLLSARAKKGLLIRSPLRKRWKGSWIVTYVILPLRTGLSVEKSHFEAMPRTYLVLHSVTAIWIRKGTTWLAQTSKDTLWYGIYGGAFGSLRLGLLILVSQMRSHESHLSHLKKAYAQGWAVACLDPRTSRLRYVARSFIQVVRYVVEDVCTGSPEHTGKVPLNLGP